MIFVFSRAFGVNCGCSLLPLRRDDQGERGEFRRGKRSVSSASGGR